MTASETCADRIAKHLASRAEHVAELFAIADGDDVGEVDGEEMDRDAAYDRLYELPLGISSSITFRVDLSAGGPADYLTAEVAKHERFGFELAGPVVYHFADWFDHAEMTLDDGHPLHRYLEDFILAGLEELPS